MVEAISDVTVRISVLSPQSVVGLGIPAVFVAGTTPGIEEFKSLEGLTEKYTAGTSVHAKAKAVFNQINKPSKIIVITYTTGEIVAAAEDHFFSEWHFALLAENVPADALALSNFIEGQGYKFLVVQLPDVAGLAQFNGNSLTIGVVHSVVGEHLDAALVGDAASATVGSLTWKFRKNLVGISPSKVTQGELEAIHTAGGIAYVTKAGIAQTSEGKTVGGEFIDALHGDQWIKATIETRLQTLMTNTDKISFDANGIALLDSELTTVFEQAYTNGIVNMNDETEKGDYTITALQRVDLDPADIAARNYEGLSFRYKRAGAIHAVDVSGTVEV